MVAGFWVFYTFPMACSAGGVNSRFSRFSHNDPRNWTFELSRGLLESSYRPRSPKPVRRLESAKRTIRASARRGWDFGPQRATERGGDTVSPPGSGEPPFVARATNAASTPYSLLDRIFHQPYDPIGRTRQDAGGTPAGTGVSPSVASHQVISALRANPESACGMILVSGQRRLTCATMRWTSSSAPAAPSMFEGRSVLPQSHLFAPHFVPSGV